MTVGINFGKRLKDVRGSSSMPAAASEVGVHQNTWKNYEHNKTVPDGDTLAEICLRFNVNPAWLLLGIGPKDADGSLSEAFKRMGPYSGTPVNMDDYVFINLASPTLSAGDGNVVMSESYKGKYAFRRDWFHSLSTSLDKAVLMIVRGDSMYPTLEDNDMVMIDVGKQRVDTGKVYAVNIGGENLHIKRLEDRGGTIRVMSDNSVYEPVDVPLPDIRVIGQVIWHAHQWITGAYNNHK